MRKEEEEEEFFCHFSGCEELQRRRRKRTGNWQLQEVEEAWTEGSLWVETA